MAPVFSPDVFDPTVFDTGGVSADGTLELTGTATGARVRTATAAALLELIGSANGGLQKTGEASGTLELTGSAEGTTAEIGEAAALLELMGSATGQVVGPITLRPTRFSIRSSLQQPSDQWEAEIPGPEEFVDLDPDRTVNLEIGLEDSSGVAQALRVMTDAIVDEYRLELQDASQVSHLKGRDAGAALLEEQFSTVYQRFPGQPLTAEVDVTVKVGVFRAKAVAEEIIASAGLTPAWQCRDYELWEDFDATGRKIDILQRLVDPWCSVEPSRVDIFVEGTTVFLRPRRAFPPVADFVLAYNATGSAPHAFCTNVNVRKTRLPIYGEVTLQGREEPADDPHTFDPPEGEPGVASTFVEIIPFVRNVDEEGGVTFTPGRLTQRSASRSFQDGQVIAMVETISTYQIPNQVLIETRKNSYSLVDGVLTLVKTEVKGTDYQEFKYDAKGPTNSPLPLHEFARIFAHAEEDTPNGLTVRVFKQVSDETTSYAYDEDNYLTTASTLKRVDRDGALVNDSLIIKHYQDIGPLLYQIQTDRYRFEEQDTEEVGSSGELETVTRFVPVLIASDTTQSSGHRPGGPNRPPQKPLATDFSGIVALPIQTVTRVSSDPKAQAASAGGRDMSAEDLAFIQAQHDEASGLYEAELSFTALSLPHLKRGSIIQITGIEDEDGSGIQVATGFVPGVTGLALIYALDMDYDEEQARSVSQIRAVWWEPPP